MIVAITGGTGFIGKRLVLRHLAAGDTVRVLTRRPSTNTGLPETVHLYHANLTNSAEDLIPFVDGADVLYHCAGEIRNEACMQAVHVTGTNNLLDAAVNKIGRWVQLSSVGVYGPQFSGIITEETPLNPVGIYETTKTESERLLIQAGERRGIDFSILRPCKVYGPEMRNRDLFQLINVINNGLFFFIGKPGAYANYIHVDNVVEGLVRCGTMSAAQGKIYNIADSRTLEDFVSTISHSLGKPLPTLRLPKPLVTVIVLSLSWLPRWPLTLSRVAGLTSTCIYSNLRIEQELEYRHLHLMEDGLCEIVDLWKQTLSV
ncbi:NAD(P)-dependent oxidoreductase [Microcoleus sp. FACHB-68]|uniref:NAD-dependent epimerase/dehydratase family protein n=1 Tax=Microcoleus sp. FACHB-68 TaxID=2692826 RepID=UPI001682F543|nr:NAD(P)-dependent oxidoreductase [Microcoleus sp. FACHB-68]MBD1940418.1 NAD(P)-dependent oxidoreductase [Microcoleus sp. FACHB-68]